MQKQLNIVILDAHPANPGDLSWAGIAEYGNLTVYEHCPPDPAEIIRRAAQAEIVLTNKAPFTKEVIDQLPNLKFIAVQATGYNIIDTKYAREKGIIVSNVPAYSTNSVAQLTFAMILDFYSETAAQNKAVHEGKWVKSEDFTFYTLPLSELANRTLGIIGFGTIGQLVGRIANAFGMKVIYHSRSPKQVDYPAQQLPMEQLLAQSDIVSLHCPQTQETTGLMNAERLALMKDSAILINTARGGLIDEPALAAALNTGKLFGAGLDVLSTEPPKPENPLLTARNCRLTPHVAWATLEARARLIQILEENVRAFIAGNPINVVN